VGCLGDTMFSRRPRALERIEIIYPGENFTWQEDQAIAAERRKVRKREMWTLMVGVLLAAAALGNAVGIGWLLSTATEARALFIAGPS
jgi:hypothetical protein